MKKVFLMFLAVAIALCMTPNLTFAGTASGNGGTVSKSAAAAQSVSKKKAKKLNTAMNKVLKKQGKNLKLAGLSVIAVKKGKVVYRYAGGYRHINNKHKKKSLKFKASTRMRVASVSKTFVAVAIMQQVEKGKINLDADVSNYLGFKLRNPNFPDKIITCRMLLSHNGSLRDGEGSNLVYCIAPKYSLSEFFLPGGKYYANGTHFASNKGPGEYFEYANINFSVLATVLEKVTGKRFDKYMTQKVLRPMGIKGSYNVSDFNKSQMKNLAAGYKKHWDASGAPIKGSKWITTKDNFKGKVQNKYYLLIVNPDGGNAQKKVSIKNYKIGKNASAFSPAGGLRISANELAKYIQMYINNGKSVTGKRILKKSTVNQMFAPQWTWNGKKPDAEGSNGDSEYGLMACWGLGLQIITNGKYNDGYGDTFLKDRKDLNLTGHYGDAYNMFSLFMVDRAGKMGFAYVCNGAECDIYSEIPYGEYSENWIWEENIVTNLYKYIF